MIASLSIIIGSYVIARMLEMIANTEGKRTSTKVFLTIVALAVVGITFISLMDIIVTASRSSNPLKGL